MTAVYGDVPVLLSQARTECAEVASYVTNRAPAATPFPPPSVSLQSLPGLIGHAVAASVLPLWWCVSRLPVMWVYVGVNLITQVRVELALPRI
jgi:hypothetical protein